MFCGIGRHFNIPLLPAQNEITIPADLFRWIQHLLDRSWARFDSTGSGRADGRLAAGGPFALRAGGNLAERQGGLAS